MTLRAMNAGNPKLLKVALLPGQRPGSSSLLQNLVATFHDSKILPESSLLGLGPSLSQNPGIQNM